MQQPVIVQTEQIFLIAQHSLAERPIEQAHIPQRKRERRKLDFILNLERRALPRGIVGRRQRRDCKSK
jgi:hypothetical protein